VDQENVVSTVEGVIDGVTHKASYFIDQSVIHAVINGKNYRSPIGPAGANATVKALLNAMVSEQNRKLNAALGWRRVLSKH